MVTIVADTTCGLPHEMLRQRGIPLIPQVVIFGEECYRDDDQMDTTAFLKKLKESPGLPKTSAPEPALYQPIFSAAQNGNSIVVVAPTSKASGTFRSAEIAAQDFPGADIRVVDTMTVSCNLGTLVLLAHELACQGRTAAEIVETLNRWIPRGRLYFMVDTLEYLARGGRIGGAKKLLAELLEIKPILQIKNGQVEPFEQQRTRKRAQARLVEIAVEQCTGVADPRLCVLHVQAEEDAHGLAQEIMARLPVKEIPIYQLPPAIVVHAGPKALGVGFFV